ncbi:hypothetical protein L4X63_02635 [Geomonas sp. Red32]|uniref:hypothetical protein n=1 Tax=Geomonas sp. Red32 TaxID=2912856 RepID=UPI00202CBF63|nr:hypothetical protein [Geomonas sp. Red32]MCM0080477.1 hypothetical protein [Geomonas sp. Red32]
MKSLLSAVLIVISFACAAMAADYVDGAGQKVALPPADYVNGPTGASVTFNDDGSIKSVYAVGEAELTFGDRKDERLAMQKATMRAKANLAKFFNESIASQETMEEMVKESGTASAKHDGPTETSAVRETLGGQLESIRNSASSILKGVITLGSQIDRPGKIVRVAIGTNEKLMKYADNMAAKTKQDLSDPPAGAAKGNAGGSLATGAGSAPAGMETRSNSVRDF